MQEKKYYPEINIARGIAVILVLLGHSFPDAQTGFAYIGAWWVFDFLYAFHMGLFFMLSGFVSSANLYAGDVDIKKEVVKKCKRLLVPYAVYSVITLVLKLFMNEYANNPFAISDVWKIVLGKNPNGGLWYLWTLFMISVLMLFVSRIIGSRTQKSKTWILMLLGVVAYVAWKILPSSYYSNILKYLLFYNIGAVLFIYYEKIKKKFFNGWVSVAALLVVFLWECAYWNLKTEYIVTALLGSYAILTFSIMISQHCESKVFQFMNFAGDYSYDIYMISYFVQVPIRVVCWGILQLPYGIDFLLMFVCGFWVPCLTSKYIIRKVPIFRKLFIGDWK